MPQVAVMVNGYVVIYSLVWFWSKGDFGNWSNFGCQQVSEQGAEEVVCNCTHLTHFGYLLVSIASVALETFMSAPLASSPALPPVPPLPTLPLQFPPSLPSY